MRGAGDFDECYRATSRRLLSYAYALTGDWTQAQDIVQEAYLKAWRQWGRLSHYEDVEAWLRLIVHRQATDSWRRLVRWRRAMPLLTAPTQTAPPDESAVLVSQALAELPLTHRRVLALHYLFDLPVAQIAVDTGVPSSTVTTWLARGRAALSTALIAIEVSGK
ncbi:RNA polymerase sigma factor [Catellatospora tritici]|uniref:RNA polymerase sigma factor n=1 Tax=Catellatospora tritici TaxID=2851566 RepID=UPI001C2D284B|nr:sigma-70 family RNA polymerase sigma factor [Catellatospora tritici]MBV1853747.1 sigma-70 family RNA polymerase sigma factor [Catellatospora tritici]